MLKTYKKQYQPNLNTQVIIHTEINNYKNKYIRNLSPENLIIPLTKSNRNQKK